MFSANISRVLDALKSGRTTALELCEKSLTRVEKTKELNAFITVLGKSAKQAANESHQNILNGNARQLEGLPIAVKDNFCTTGVRTTCASNMLRDFVPPYSATVVNRLVNKSGAVLVGKTNLDEFAMGCGSVDGAFGPVKNPWRYRFKYSSGKSHSDNKNSEDEVARSGDVAEDWCISGGSSGGSAVAVASGCVYAALGSDTGGSTRNPASYCGVVGLKPSYGLLSRHGLIPLVNSMDVPGIITRSVDDSATILNVLAGHDVNDSTTIRDSFTPVKLSDNPSVKGIKIGIPIEYHAPGLSQETVSRWQHVADLLSDSGAEVRQVSLPHTQYSIVCYHVLCACEVCSNMARYDGLEYGHRARGMENSTEQLYAATRHEGFNDVVRGRILAGNYFLLKQNYEKYFLQAQKNRRLITQDFISVFDSVDALLTPTVLGDAPDYKTFSSADNRTRTQEQDVFTQPANLAGVPAITLPVGLSERGFPIGLQLIGRHYDEQTLLGVAKAVEQLVTFKQLDLSSLDS